MIFGIIELLQILIEYLKYLQLKLQLLIVLKERSCLLLEEMNTMNKYKGKKNRSSWKIILIHRVGINLLQMLLRHQILAISQDLLMITLVVHLKKKEIREIDLRSYQRLLVSQRIHHCWKSTDSLLSNNILISNLI